MPDLTPADPHFRADVLAGLSQPQPAVPARWFYDYAGSALFEEITELPEYYPTRTEAALLDAVCPELRRRVPNNSAVVEFGSGSSAKTPRLLRCIAPASYVPIDISGDFLREAAADLAAGFPELAVHPVEADFTRQVTLPGAIAGQPILGFFPGSTIGNMVPESGGEPAAVHARHARHRRAAPDRDGPGEGRGRAAARL